MDKLFFPPFLYEHRTRTSTYEFPSFYESATISLKFATFAFPPVSMTIKRVEQTPQRAAEAFEKRSANANTLANVVTADGL